MSQDNDEITTELIHNGIPYIMCFSKRDKSDFKITSNRISICAKYEMFVNSVREVSF